MKFPKFTLRRARNGQFYFTLAAANGKVIATSETYKTKAKALKGIEAIVRSCYNYDIIDATREKL